MSSVKMQDIIDFFERKYPNCYSEEWDNSGFLIGNNEKDIKKIGVCLDITSKLVEHAVSNNLNLMISHHPLIFSPLKSLSSKTVKDKVILKLIKNDINVYCAHTNLDNNIKGTGYYLAKALDLENTKDLDESFKYAKKGDFKTEEKLSDICMKVKQVLGLEHMRLISERLDEGDICFKSMVVSPGSFDESILRFVDKNSTVILSSDLKYHTASDARQEGYTIIDAGHYATENLLCEILVKDIQNEFPDIESVITMDSRDPFINL